jgi:hypothetical protein
MSRPRLRRPLLVLALLALAAAPAAADPVDSDLAAAMNGGGCQPTGLQPGLFDMLTLINPEWAPVLNGPVVTSEPVLVHGTVMDMHGDTSGDFPATHVRADVNHFVQLDPEDAARLATGNDDGLLHFEWEAGAYPAWAWAGPGDRIVGLGRWIFDCGHTGAIPGSCSVTTPMQCAIDSDCPAAETCVDAHYAYSAELHPPQATAAIRSGRGAVASKRKGATPVPATRADIFVSADAGGAGDRCILTHQAADDDLFQVQCFPLSEPVAPLNAENFVFDVPLPPKPPGAKRATWRLVRYPAPGGKAAHVRVRKKLHDSPPHLHVTVRMKRGRGRRRPTGFAGTLFAGWKGDPSPLSHVRLTLDSVVIHNALQPVTPVAPLTCSESGGPCAADADCPSGEVCTGVGPVKSWVLQASVDGEWQEFPGLESVDSGDEIPLGLVYDEYLPPDGELHLLAQGRSHECIDALYGKSLGVDVQQLGLGKGIACLASEARDPGEVDVTYPGPDFGAGAGTMSYETASLGGVGGHCAAMTGLLCTGDDDCPGDSCVVTGGAFSLRYHIDRLP